MIVVLLMVPAIRTHSIVLSILLLFACHPPVKTGADNILQNPDYTAINDSIAQFPTNAVFYFERAVRLTKGGAHEQASPDFLKAWTLDPKPEYLGQYASNLAILGEQPARLNLLQQGVKKYPGDRQIQRMLADAYVQTGSPATAIALYEAMLQQDSVDFETWYEKGLLEEENKDSTAAIQSLRQAYRLQPLNDYGMELAHLYAEKKNPLALSICNLLLQQDVTRSLTDPFMIKGIYYANVHQYPQAIIQFDSCIGRDWKTTDAYIEKGILFFKQKKFREALKIFQMAATVSNTDADAYFWMGRCYESLGEKEEAVANYQRAISLDRNFSEAKDGINRLKP